MARRPSAIDSGERTRMCRAAAALLLPALPLCAGVLVLPPRPPRGINSFDYQYDRRSNPAVPAWNETTFRRLALAQKSQLLSHGYDTIVIDGGWSADLIDAYGRPIPNPELWPSAAGGGGFAPLAAWTHGLGLKFGVWTLRGVSPQAVAARSPVIGAFPPTTVDQIVYSPATCPTTAPRWCNCTWDSQGRGVDPSRSGAQAYYDSVVQLYADWGVDLIKWDCMYDGNVAAYSGEEELAVAAVRKATRPMVLSLSPGGGMAPDAAAWAAGYPGGRGPAGGSASAPAERATMYRVTGDFHSRPKAWIDGLGEHVFVVGNLSSAYPGIFGANNTWPDLDIVDLGAYSAYHNTPAAQLHAAIWMMARSPLMFGGKMPIDDSTTLNLVTNQDALLINELSAGLKVSYSGDCRCSLKGATNGHACRPNAPKGAEPCVATWSSNVGSCKAVAVLNIGLSTAVGVEVTYRRIGLPKTTEGYTVRHVYEKLAVPGDARGFNVTVPSRGGSLMLVARASAPGCVPGHHFV